MHRIISIFYKKLIKVFKYQRRLIKRIMTSHNRKSNSNDLNPTNNSNRSSKNSDRNVYNNKNPGFNAPLVLKDR